MLSQVTRRAVLGAVTIPLARLTAFASDDSFAAAEGQIRGILSQRIDIARESLGIVVGLAGRTTTRFIAHGSRSAADRRVPDRDTLYGIGPITKLFTAILLADAVQRKEMSYYDPLSLHLPDGVRVPELDGKAITLADLATHTSGLPFMPDDYPSESDRQGRSHYTQEKLYAFLASYELVSPPGSQWRYSDLGYALLTAALAHRTGIRYEALLQRVTWPMNLRSSVASLSKELASRLVPGHDQTLEATAPFNEPIMLGAKGLYSSAADLAALLQAFLGYRETPLASALASMLQIRRPMHVGNGQQAIGLQIFGEGAHIQIGHGGSDSGYASSVAWTPGRFGVVVLSNCAPPVLDIAAHLLDPSLPLGV